MLANAWRVDPCTQKLRTWLQAVQWVLRDSNSSIMGNRVFALTHIAMWRALLKNAKTHPPANDIAVAGAQLDLSLSRQSRIVSQHLLIWLTARLIASGPQRATGNMLRGPPLHFSTKHPLSPWKHMATFRQSQIAILQVSFVSTPCCGPCRLCGPPDAEQRVSVLLLPL